MGPFAALLARVVWFFTHLPLIQVVGEAYVSRALQRASDFGRERLLVLNGALVTGAFGWAGSAIGSLWIMRLFHATDRAVAFLVAFWWVVSCLTHRPSLLAWVVVTDSLCDAWREGVLHVSVAMALTASVMLLFQPSHLGTTALCAHYVQPVLLDAATVWAKKKS